MGSNPSNQKKLNQAETQEYTELRKKILRSGQDLSPKAKSNKNSPGNSPKNSPKGAPNNNSPTSINKNLLRDKNGPSSNNQSLEAPSQNINKNKKFDSPRQQRNPSSLQEKYDQRNPSSLKEKYPSRSPSTLKQNNYEPNKDAVNEKSRRQSTRQNTQFLGGVQLEKKGQYQVGILLLKMTPENNSGKEIKPQKSQISYEALLKWNFDEKNQKWNFALEKPETKELNFIISRKGQLLKGEEDKWELFNPSYADYPRKQTEFYKEQFISESLERNSYWHPSYAQLKSNKKNLCSEWKEEYSERVVEFPPVRSFTKMRKNDNAITDFKAYHEIRKFFDKDSDDWQMTLDIVENDYKFHAFMTWKVLPEDDHLDQLIQRHKRILELKKQIYTQKVRLLTA